VAEIRAEFRVVFGGEMMAAKHRVIYVIVAIAVRQLRVQGFESFCL
jgi:hypothetical protein